MLCFTPRATTNSIKTDVAARIRRPISSYAVRIKRKKATADFLWHDPPKYVGDYMHVSLAFAFSLLPFANIQMYHQGVKLTGPRSGTT